MLSQYKPFRKKRSLADLDFDFPENTNAVGRLDENSEGLLILTTDKTLHHLLLHPSKLHPRIYLVQVHGIVTDHTTRILSEGITIRVKGEDYKTKPAQVSVCEAPAWLPERGHPVGDHFASSWLEMILIEGKNHQVKKMTMQAGHQTMRLIRVGIENLALNFYTPGQVIELSKQEIFEKLNINETVLDEQCVSQNN